MTKYQYLCALETFGPQTHAVAEGSKTGVALCGENCRNCFATEAYGLTCKTCAALLAGEKPLFDFAMIDFPWNFKTYSDKGRDRSPKYAVQDLDWIKRLDIPSILAPNACIGLWVIDSMLPEALEVVRAWGKGFKFSSVLFYWAKTNRLHSDGPASLDKTWHMGTGYGTRANPEQCWLIKRGKGLKRMSASVRRLLVAPAGAHSAKPEAAHERAEKLYWRDGLQFIDIFAREPKRGWAVWGNEVESAIQIPELPF